MVVQDEVTWLLETIKDSWNGTFPDNLARFNRDEPKVIYPDDTEERTNSPDAQRYNTVGVSKGSVNREFRGQKPQYRTVTVLDVRVTARADEEWGEETNVSTFETLVREIQETINQNISYPSVDESPSNDTGTVTYHDVGVFNEQPLSSQFKDQYRTDFEVRLRGDQDTP